MVTEIELFEFLDLIFVCGVWCRTKFIKRKVDTRDELLTHILDAQKENSDEQHAISEHELHGALRLTVGFSNIYVYCEL